MHLVDTLLRVPRLVATQYAERQLAVETDISNVTLERLRHERLRVLTKVPFYQTWALPVGTGISLADGSTRVTRKEDLRSGLAQFRIGGWKELLPRKVTFTSGSTGSPMRLERTFGDAVLEAAFFGNWRKSLGWHPKMRVVVLRGHFPKHFQTGQVALRTTANELWLNSFKLSMETIDLYAAALKDFKPDILYAYPSAAETLLRLLSDAGHTVMRGVRTFTSSESLRDQVRKKICEITGFPARDWYGNAERSAAAGECAAGRYHFFFNYADVAATSSGELVATPLRWQGYGLFNYATGDLVTDLRVGECRCGDFGVTAAAIEGRISDYVIAADGSQVGRLDKIYLGLETILEAQIRQHVDTSIVVSVVLAWVNSDELQLLRSRLHQRVGDLDISVIRVTAIERTSAGKFKEIIRDA